MHVVIEWMYLLVVVVVVRREMGFWVGGGLRVYVHVGTRAEQCWIEKAPNVSFGFSALFWLHDSYTFCPYTH